MQNKNCGVHPSSRKTGLKSLCTPASCPMWWQTKKRHYIEITLLWVCAEKWQRLKRQEFSRVHNDNYLVLPNKYTSEGQRSWRLFPWIAQALSRALLLKLAQQGGGMAGCRLRELSSSLGWDKHQGWVQEGDWTGMLGREGRVNPFGSSELLDQPSCHVNPHINVP